MSLSATTSPTSDDAYECAAGLIRSLLGGVELPSPPARPAELLHRGTQLHADVSQILASAHTVLRHARRPHA